MKKVFVILLVLVGFGCAEPVQYEPDGRTEISARLNSGYYSVVIFASGGPFEATWWVDKSPVGTPELYAVNTHTDHLFTMNGGLSDPSLELVFGIGAASNLNTTLYIETKALDHNSFVGTLKEYVGDTVVERWVLFGSKHLPSCYRYFGDGTCREY